MGILTTITRMWLLRSMQPFSFVPDNGETPPDIADTPSPGLYVHIPFCRAICNFCPYCKQLFQKELCQKYTDALIQEIERVSSSPPGRVKATSLYFGGGSPALAADRLPQIISALREHFDITDGIGVELHPDDVCISTLEALRAAGVTRLSIGVQSFQERYQNILGRRAINLASLRQALQAVPFQTVSMDFIFALPGQTCEELKRDLDLAFAHGANHVAIYPFIQFSFTDSKTPLMPNPQKRRLLDETTTYLRSIGCRRDSIWTFTNTPAGKYSSMTRDTFLGFGCSATTLLKNQFRINTFSVEEYCKRIDRGRLPTSLKLDFTPRQRMVYWLFWKLYTTRLARREFEEFFGVPLEDAYGMEIRLAKRMGFLTETDGILQLTDKGAFAYHHYENYYTLAYIDKMWGLMRKEAFPAGFTL